MSGSSTVMRGFTKNYVSGASGRVLEIRLGHGQRLGVWCAVNAPFMDHGTCKIQRLREGVPMLGRHTPCMCCHLHQWCQ